MIEFEQPSQRSEAISADLRSLVIDPVAWEFRVDATRIEFIVQAELVSSNSNALQRVRLDFDVWFTDGPNGDDGLVMSGSLPPVREVVVFTDGEFGDDGLDIWMPLTAGSDVVTFSEATFRQAFAIHNTEFVTFADYAVAYVLSFANANEQFIFSDISIAGTAVFDVPESVSVFDSLTTLGGSSVALSESITISEIVSGGPFIALGESWAVFESWYHYFDYPLFLETVTWTDKLVVSVVAATDARPGAFIPGSALLGSPS